MADTLVCSFHKSGHCRYGAHCHKKHILDTCTIFPCNKVTCPKRHPKLCKYFTLSGFCKFQENCSYLHLINNQELKTQLEAEVANLRKEIQSLYKHVNELAKVVNNLSTQSKNSSSVDFFFNPAIPSASNSSNSSTLTLAMSTTVKKSSLPYPQENENIPQLDGDQSPPCTYLPFKCETCEKVFTTEAEFREHDSFQFCCDECLICFSTQVAAHLHELEVHPGSHYASTYIPQSTKQMFASIKS